MILNKIHTCITFIIILHPAGEVEKHTGLSIWKFLCVWKFFLKPRNNYLERDHKIPPTQDLLSKYKNKRERKVIEKTEGKEGKEERERNRKVETGQAVARQREKKRESKYCIG